MDGWGYRPCPGHQGQEWRFQRGCSLRGPQDPKASGSSFARSRLRCRDPRLGGSCNTRAGADEEGGRAHKGEEPVLHRNPKPTGARSGGWVQPDDLAPSSGPPGSGRRVALLRDDAPLPARPPSLAPGPQLGLRVASQQIRCPSAQSGAEERAGGFLPFWSPLPIKDVWNLGCAPLRSPARPPLQTLLLTRRDTPSALGPGMMRKVSGREIPAVFCFRRLHRDYPAPRGALSPTGSIFNLLTVGGARPPAP